MKYIKYIFEGEVKCFYPQGVIFSVGGFQGVANYNECLENSDKTNMYPKHIIKGIITGYNEMDMWIKITDSKVL